MKVYDLMIRLGQLSPYAEIGCAWDGAIADIVAAEVCESGVVVLLAPDYASLDIRMQDDVAGHA